MKLTGIESWLICGLLFCCSVIHAQSNDTLDRIVLNMDWEFS